MKKWPKLLGVILYFSYLNPMEKTPRWWTQQLISALNRGDLVSAQKALKNGAKTEKIWESLMWQAAFALMVRNSKPSVYDERQMLFYTPMKTALACGMVLHDKFLILPFLTFDQEIIQPFIRSITVNTRCSRNWSLLHYAVGTGTIEIVKLLVERGANIYTKNSAQHQPQDITTSPEIRNYLLFVADFYAANGKNRQKNFSSFAKKHLSGEQTEQYRTDTYNLAHLGEKRFAQQFYRWLKKNNHLDKYPLLKTDIRWFYLELASRETDNLFRQYCWFKECFTYYTGNNKRYPFEQAVEKQIKNSFTGATRDLLTAERNRWLQQKNMYNNKKRSNLIDIKISCAKNVLS